MVDFPHCAPCLPIRRIGCVFLINALLIHVKKFT
jgi:hypothetical protein